jgi:CHAT domain-containing protein/Tfp pilus assembly protein PilF
MLKWMACGWVSLILTLPVAGQSSNANLKKAKELFLAEEYHPARYFLKKTQGLNKSDQAEARLLLSELFLMTNQRDSALAVLQSIEPFRKTEIDYLQALLDFQDNNLLDALEKLNALRTATITDNILLGRISYYRGVINYRLRSSASLAVAISDLQQAITFFNKDSLQTYLKIALARLQLADTFRETENSPEAIQQLKWAAKILDTSPYARPLYLARSYGILAKVYYNERDYFNGKPAFEKTIKLQLEAHADSSTLGNTLCNLALFYDELGDPYACEKTYERALAYLPVPKTAIDNYVAILNNYALFLNQINESSTSIQTLLRAKQLLETGRIQSRKYVFQTYFNLATVFYDLEDFTSCKTYLDLLDSFQKDNPAFVDRGNKIKIQKLRAAWWRKNKQFDKAVDVCKNIISEMDSTTSNRLKSNFYATYGDILISSGDFPASRIFLRKALAIDQKREDLRAQVTDFNLLAMSFYNQELYDSVSFAVLQSLALNSMEGHGLIFPYRDPQDAIHSCYLYMISRLKQYQKTKRTEYLDMALPYEKMGIDLIRTIRKNLYSDADRILYNEQVTNFYDAGYLLYLYRWEAGMGGADSRLFEYVEESKFQALANTLGLNRVRSFGDVSTALLAEERDLARQKILDNRQLVNLIDQEDSTEETRVRQKETALHLQWLEQKHDRFIDSLQRNFTGYYLLKYGGHDITLRDLQKELEPGHLVLQIKAMDSLCVIQLITRDFVSLYPIRHIESLKRQITKLRNQIQFKLQTDFVPQSHDVFLSVIKPALDELKKNKTRVNRLTVIPDDFFYQLPFEALVERPKPLRYLIQSHEIAYAYSGNLMIQNKRVQVLKTNKTFLGIAPEFTAKETNQNDSRSAPEATSSTASYDDFGFPPLTENIHEVNLIGSLMDNRSVKQTVLRGSDATEAHLKKLDLSQFKYVHFATHGFVNAQKTGLSGLALTNLDAGTEDNILYTSEIYNLNLKAELVCLSACETGLGQNEHGEGLIGLGRAFFYSGARNLLVSLWKVPDESTAQFMIDFYKYTFDQSEHFQSSLQKAKLEMLKSKKYQSPYYWAPFILIGSY